MNRIVKTLVAVVPVAVGVGAYVWQSRNAAGARRVPVVEEARAMRVLTVAAQTVVPEVRGYGVVESGRTWRAVARVEGKVVAVHPTLAPGARIAAGAVLLELEQAPYQLALAQREADVARLAAELDELALREENDRGALAIEEESLALAQAELARQEELQESGTVSGSKVDSTARSVLTQRQSVQALQADLALAPTRRAAKEAALAAERARLAQAHLDLEHTRLVAPFDLVCGPVALEVDQFVARGEPLFEGYGIDLATLDAELLYGDARRLVGPEAAARLLAARADGPVPAAEVEALFTATVTVESGDLRVDWDARVIGMRELVRSATRALSVRVAVDGPYESAVPGTRPPLLRGTFCEVRLRGLPLAGRLVVPRTAVLGDAVWVLDDEDRMRPRPVRIAFEQGEAAVVADGLAAGDRVVVSDPGPALAGALVAPVEDAQAARALAADVAGDGR